MEALENKKSNYNSILIIIIIIIIIIIDLYSARTIQTYSKALYIKLK